MPGPEKGPEHACARIHQIQIMPGVPDNHNAHAVYKILRLKGNENVAYKNNYEKKLILMACRVRILLGPKNAGLVRSMPVLEYTR